MDISVIEDRKALARSWFEALRNDICAAFERLEDDAPAALYPGSAGRFVRTPWDRTDHSGQGWLGGRLHCDAQVVSTPRRTGDTGHHLCDETDGV